MDWTWQGLIPTGLWHVGAFATVIALLLQAATPDKNSKLACWLATVGGFGMAGGTAGWIGGALGATTDTVSTYTGQLTAQLTGVSIPFLFAGLGLLLLWKKAGKGGSGLPNGKKKADKAKQFAWLFSFACVGTVIAGVPPLWDWADTGVNTVGTAILAFTPA